MYLGQNMSRAKLVQDGYRGWYGRENKYNAALRVGMKSLTEQSAKNEMIKCEYKKLMKKLQTDEKQTEIIMKRQLRKIRMELIEMRAYGEAYHQLSFMNFDGSNHDLSKEKGGQGKSLKPSQNKSTKIKKTSELASAAQKNQETPKYEKAHVRFENSTQDNRFEKSDDNLKSTLEGDENPDSSGYLKTIIEDDEVFHYDSDDHNSDENSRVQSCTPKASTSDKTDYCISEIEEDFSPKLFLTEAPDDESDDDYERSNKYINPFLGTNSLTKSEPSFQMESPQLLERRRSCAEENAIKLHFFKSLSMKRGHLDSENTNRERNNTVVSLQNFTRRRQRPQLKLWENELSRSDRISTVFPGQCRNTFTLRKVVNEKAGQLIYEWTPENVRKVRARKILESMSLPEIVSRRKTTSAIYRDYHKYKDRYQTFDRPRAKSCTVSSSSINKQRF